MKQTRCSHPQRRDREPRRACLPRVKARREVYIGELDRDFFAVRVAVEGQTVCGSKGDLLVLEEQGTRGFEISTILPLRKGAHGIRKDRGANDLG